MPELRERRTKNWSSRRVSYGLQIENAVTTSAPKLRPLRARVTRDVRVRDMSRFTGARAEGSITLVERGGRLKDQARLGSAFTLSSWPTERAAYHHRTIYRRVIAGARERREDWRRCRRGRRSRAILGGKKVR